MINYSIQIILFQALFLAVYDFFLQKETFFKWNRIYLLLTPILSFVIPLLKLDSIKNTVSQDYMILLPEVVLNPQAVIEQTVLSTEIINYLNEVFYVGIAFFSILFLTKLFKIIKVIASHKIIKKEKYKLVLLEDQQSAFSFFNYIFITQKLTEKKELQIIQHELVHSKQLHTLDLLFFEIFKIAMWFNPILYIYQKRISELHEYISDAEVVKETDKHSYFNKLLSETFKVENISFINQFYKKSFIKKRIIMITKNKSRKMKQLKYLVLIPVLASMLLYSSCETNELSPNKESKKELSFSDNTEPIVFVDGKEVSTEFMNNLKPNRINSMKILKGKESTDKYGEKAKNGVIEIELKKDGYYEVGNKDASQNEDVPFAVIDKVPVFPGCEDANNLKDCFNKSVQKHVVDNFNADVSKNLDLESGVKKIYVQFKILKSGDIEILGVRAPHKDLEAEARRVVSLLPKMIPGENNGKAVNVTYMLPIAFNIE